MKRLITIVLAAFVAGSGFTSKGVWVIDARSQLTIQGSTNVNDFVCRIEYCSGTDTLRSIENTSTKELRFTHSRMSVPVKSFSCGSRPISKDFWKTVKAESHPYLIINFISLDNVYFKEKTRVKGVVDITLAGVTARYNICYDVSIKDSGSLLLRGSHTFNFSDFQLTAPQKLNGLIKVKEVLKVDFNLVLKEI